MKNLYASNSKNKELALDLIKNMNEDAKTEFHAVSVIKDGKLLVKFALPPYDTADANQVYSLSKAFCSTAAGFAFDEGLFKLEDRIVDIFPESVPEDPSENLLKLTVKHVISMNSGHSGCTMGAAKDASDPVRAFMEKKIDFEPGTHFVYNTGATMVIAAMVEKLTGKSVIDYLGEKLFCHLGVFPAKWQRLPNGGYLENVPGICEGGVGLYVQLDCIERFGEFILGGGVYNGKRLLSKEWLDIATSKVSDNSGNGTKDWTAGYGFQFWMNADGGFRGDGAFGQLCIVLPEDKTVISVICKSEDMQREIDVCTSFAKALDPVSDEGCGVFEDEIIENACAPEKPEITERFGGIGKAYAFGDNFQKFTSVSFTEDNASVSVILGDSERLNKVTSGYGEYIRSDIFAYAFKPTLNGLIPYRSEDIIMFTSVKKMSERELVLSVRFGNSVHKGTLTFVLGDDGTLSMNIYYNCDRFANGNEKITNLSAYVK